MLKRLIQLALLGFLVYLFWPYDVFRLAHHNPHTTALIERRKQEARSVRRTLKPKLIWEPLGAISPNLLHAVLLAEDDTFYHHHGFDLEQIRIAIAEDLEKRKYAYGGSTITQQLARTLYLRPRKSILRKLKEAVLTVYLEAALPKRRILEIYLNVVEWGPGVYGAEAAAQSYFSKPAVDLTPDESVALASILPSPRRWSPFSEKAFMARRRTQLIERMQKAGYAPVTFLDGDQAAVLPIDPNAILDLPPPATVAPTDRMNGDELSGAPAEPETIPAPPSPDADAPAPPAQ